jgi:hypothetical protein
LGDVAGAVDETWTPSAVRLALAVNTAVAVAGLIGSWWAGLAVTVAYVTFVDSTVPVVVDTIAALLPGRAEAGAIRVQAVDQPIAVVVYPIGAVLLTGRAVRVQAVH